MPKRQLKVPKRQKYVCICVCMIYTKKYMYFFGFEQQEYRISEYFTLLLE